MPHPAPPKTQIPESARADRELSEAEIEARFGSLLAEGIEAFRLDPHYVCRIAEVAAQLRRERLAWASDEQYEAMFTLRRKGAAFQQIARDTGVALARVTKTLKCPWP